MVNEEQNSQWYTEARMRELLAEKDAALADLRAKVEALAEAFELRSLSRSEVAQRNGYVEAAFDLRAVLEGGR